MLAPHGNWRTAQAAVDRLMVGADNVEGDVSLKFPQSQSRMPLRVVLAKLLRVAECGTGHQVEFSHLCPDQALDVATEARLCRRTPFDRDASILAPSLEGPA